ncbi:MAG: phosphate ABC transporter substrate-binding protein [Endomicrobium sp.]|jgi:phosphate transport system substrate-binding protein|nr:phosphate ABC transporter substrate-binding protein [Endomicrobium sp.]
MKKIILLYSLFSIFCSLSFIACSRPAQNGAKGQSIQIKGSDTIVNLVQVWAERFVENKPDLNIGVTGGGSGTGFAALFNNTCNIAMSSREIEEKEKVIAEGKNIEPVEFKVGLDGLAILVHKDNPVDKLTISQLRDIFMAKITNWKELGGKDLKIVILSRESNSGTHMFFKEHVIRNGDKTSKDEFSVHSLLMPSSQAIYDEVLQNPNALGYAGMGFINNQVKAVSVAVDENSQYVYPTSDNVLSGKYPVSRPLYLYTNGLPQGLTKDFINYALSEEGQKIVLETDFVPIITINPSEIQEIHET